MVKDRPTDAETTARGAAIAAGIGIGAFDIEYACRLSVESKTYHPMISSEECEKRVKKWHDAVERTLNWEN